MKHRGLLLTIIVLHFFLLSNSKITYGLIKKNLIGCKFEISLCQNAEQCYEDNLFGTCLERNDEANYLYEIDPGFKKSLVAILKFLRRQKFGWKDAYTQCYIKNAINASRFNVEFDTTVCKELKSGENLYKKREFVQKPLYQYYGKNLDDVAQYLTKKALSDTDQPPYDRTLMAFYNGQQTDSDEPTSYVYDNNVEAVSNPDDENKIDLSSPSEEQMSYIKNLNDQWDTALNAIVDGDKAIDLKRINDQKETDNLLGGIENLESLTEDNDKNSEYINPKVNAGKAISVSYTKHEDPEDALKKLKLTKKTSIKKKRQKSAEHMTVEFAQKLSDKGYSAVKDLLKFGGNGMALSVMRSDQGNVVEILNDASHERNKELRNFLVAEIARNKNLPPIKDISLYTNSSAQQIVGIILVCGASFIIVSSIVIFMCLQHSKKQKLKLNSSLFASESTDIATKEYKDLCRQRIVKHEVDPRKGTNASNKDTERIFSDRNSSSSWSDDQSGNVANMDVSTGHLILAYMEEHLNRKDKLEADWNAIVASDAADRATKSCDAAKMLENESKNRSAEFLPYDDHRVKLKCVDEKESDYINASRLSGCDPKAAGYIAAQSPLQSTVNDFWTMIWEQGAVLLVNLDSADDVDANQTDTEHCFQYWPDEGTKQYGNFEVHLVTEHIWCEDFIVRNFYLKNVSSSGNGETRTVTQFHFQNWPANKLPRTSKILLEFRRKVNRSFRSKSSPLLVHCSDGCSRSGGYILLDFVLSRISRGIKELDVAACLENLREERMGMVATKDQYAFILSSIADEVSSMLKAR